MGNYVSQHVLIPKFTTPDVSGVTFGGFMIDKYICSQPNARPDEGSPDVAHGGVVGAVPAISRPGVPMWDHVSFPQAMIACCNRGKGWHLVSGFEWAAMAFLSKKLGTQPHGGNANTNPPSDITFATEIALLDSHMNIEAPSIYRALPGTGPNTWAHNHLASGVFDLQATGWQWILLMMAATSGYAYVPANLDVSYAGSPYGRGTISGSGGASPMMTVDGAGINWLKAWTVDEFNTACYCYIAEAASGAGALYAITDTTATTIVLTNGDAPGNGAATFCVFKLVETDITAGMTDWHKILTLRDADANLKAFALPATADVTGSATYGFDIVSFDKAALRAASRGSICNVGLAAGIFSLNLSYSPTDVTEWNTGFRACKSL